MNARIKRKLDKRIKHKLIDDLPLSEFEEKYYLKQWKKSFNRRKQKQRLKLAAASEIERIDIIDEEEVSYASKWQIIKRKLKGWFGK